jgi:hypothetical protein
MGSAVFGLPEPARICLDLNLTLRRNNDFHKSTPESGTD